MRCEEIQERLSAYLDRELEPAERQALEDHLRECAGCRQELALLRQTVSTLQSLEEMEVSPQLTAAIQAGVSARGRSRWQDLASRLFFPIHIKVPLEAMALVLITLGVVYLYRSAPELAQAPQPQAVTEYAAREQAAPSTAERRDRQQRVARKESADEIRARSEVQEEREVMKEPDVAARPLQKEAPATALGGVLSIPEMILKTDNPSLAASRIASLVEGLGGKLLEKKGDNQFLLAIPASSYPRFLAALRELGKPIEPPAKPPSFPSPQGTVTFSLRLTP